MNLQNRPLYIPPPPRPPEPGESGLRLTAMHLVLAAGGLLLLLILVAITIAPRKAAERPINRSVAARLLRQAPPPEGVSPQAVSLLQQMQAAARSLNTLQVDGVYNVTSEVGTLSHQRQGAFHLTFQAPNYFSQTLETSGSVQTDRIVADGHALYLEVRAANVTLRMPEPTSAAGVAEIMSASMPGTQTPVDLFRLLAYPLDPAELEVAALTVDRHDPWIRSQPTPDGTTPLTVRFKGWPQCTLWIDQRTFLLRQVAMEIAGDQLQQVSERLGGVAPVMFRSLAQPTRVRVVVRQFATALNVPLQGAPFDYSPPPGGGVRDVTTWEEARRVLMERLGDALAAEAARAATPPTIEAPEEAVPGSGQAPSPSP
ncbi:MAG TPA: hypothetical protein VGM19_13985 [Armatimonadota bacterium]|jgi:hypothetical protein